MKFVIVGAGVTGFSICEILLDEGHDVVMIEKDPKILSYAAERLDAQMVEGNGASPLVLEPLVDEDTDVIIAVTDNDEVNIISTLIARKFGAKRGIARVCSTANLIHPLLTDDPEVSALNAEIAVARDITSLIGNPSADEIDFFGRGKAEMLKLHVTEEAAVVYKPLKDVDVPKSWLFIAVMRNNQFEITNGDTILNPGDIVLLMGDPQKSEDIEKLLGLRPEKVKRVLIIGFNQISSRLAQNLANRNIDVRLIEEDKKKASKAAEVLHDVLVFNSDGTSSDALEQAGIDQTDYLCALTEDDESNVLISLLAKEKKVKRVIVLAQKPQYKSIIEKIGIDSVISPRSTIVDDIIRQIYYKDLTRINLIEGGKGRMMEFEIGEKTKTIGKPLKNIKLPKQTIIGAIVRDGNLIIPRGEDVIQNKDHVVVFTTRAGVNPVKKVFSGK